MGWELRLFPEILWFVGDIRVSLCLIVVLQPRIGAMVHGACFDGSRAQLPLAALSVLASSPLPFHHMPHSSKS